MLNLKTEEIPALVKKRKKTFFQLPQIIGGKEAFKRFVEDNLVYPAEALEKRIEGIVHLNAEIDDNGNVINVEILHGLDEGCNEEAIRLINNVRFGTVKNKGMRLKTKKRFRIKFQLPKDKQINYRLVSKSNNEDKNKTYSYSITINQ